MDKKETLEKIFGDITQINTNKGTLYLSAFIDIHNNKILSPIVSTNQKEDIVLNGIKEIINNYEIKANTLIVHTDRGSVYTGYKFNKILKSAKITHSMSRAGHCPDNAPIERVWGIFKDETFRLDKIEFNSIDEARPLIDNLSKYYINNYCKEDFNELDKLLDVEVEEYKKLYGEGREGKEKGKYKDYKANELDYLYKRMGNAFLTEMRSYAKEQRKDLKLIEGRGEGNKDFKSFNKINITRKQINDVKRGFSNEVQHIKNRKAYKELQKEIEKEGMEY